MATPLLSNKQSLRLTDEENKCFLEICDKLGTRPAWAARRAVLDFIKKNADLVEGEIPNEFIR